MCNVCGYWWDDDFWDEIENRPLKQLVRWQHDKTKEIRKIPKGQNLGEFWHKIKDS
jgi:hypothetical protein